MPKFLYPGTRYLGPGNPYPNGPPQSSADKIAQKHDKSYIDAQSENDILESDWKYTKEFASDFVQNPSLQSAAGAIGLGLKTGAERIVGVQYPDMKTGVKRHGGPTGGAPLTKHQSGTISTSDASMDTDESVGEAMITGASATGRGASGMDARTTHIYSGNPQVPEYHTRTLRKTYHFTCQNPLPSYQKSNQADIILRYNYIQSPPVDRLRLYMSPREEALYREQYTEVNCENVRVAIHSLGARGQFTTGGTEATNANMQLQPFIAEFPGIDAHFPTTVDDSDVANFLGKLEGSNPYDIANAATFTNIIPNFPARSGSRSMSVPLSIVYPNPFSFPNNQGTATSAVENKLNFPNIYEYAHMKNGAVLSEGEPTFLYNYNPKNKFLFGRNNFTRAEAYQQTSAAQQPQTLMQTNAEFIARTQDTQGAISGGTAASVATFGDYILARNQQPADIRIENQFQHNSTEMFKPHRMPRFNFGVMPLRNSGETTNQTIQWEFLMVCEMTVRCKTGAPGIYGHTLTFPEPMYMFPTIQKGDYGNFGAVVGSPDTGTQITGFLNRRNMFGRPCIRVGATVTIPQQTGSTVNNIPITRVLRSARNAEAKNAEEKNKQK